ncbi:hypothetical protein, partial [Halorubrum sp. Atlit-26R]|uniref:hypothetical protein n=1 Tax=Halorubrum sp. Atlit-26R TaxID=2282128 RepID=UPI000F0F26DE
FHAVSEGVLKQLAESALVSMDRPIGLGYERRVGGRHVLPAVAGDRPELERGGLGDLVPALCEPQEVVDQLLDPGQRVRRGVEILAVAVVARELEVPRRDLEGGAEIV